MSENNIAKNAIVSAESSYLSLLSRILESGNDRMDRTGTGTRALFGETMRFDLSE
jgi:thymidylate synthase